MSVIAVSFHPLFCHPGCQAPPGLAVSVRADTTSAGDLRLAYHLQGGAQLRLPPPVLPGPADDLWQHTCCEAFVAGASGTGYREFNFSPSGAWAVYAFRAYRERQPDWRAEAAPQIRCELAANDVLLEAVIPRLLLPAAPARLGLSVVLETVRGEKTYWALAHVAAQPDFHLAASFTLPLP